MRWWKVTFLVEDPPQLFFFNIFLVDIIKLLLFVGFKMDFMRSGMQNTASACAFLTILLLSRSLGYASL